MVPKLYRIVALMQKEAVPANMKAAYLSTESDAAVASRLSTYLAWAVATLATWL